MSKPRTYDSFIDVDPAGKASVYNREDLLKFFSQFPGQRIAVTYSVLGKKKSQKMMGYYWAEVVQKFMWNFQENGNPFDKEETHREMKKLSPVMKRVVQAGTKMRTEPRSMSDPDFTNEDFIQYLEDLHRAAVERGFDFNDPNE